MFTRPFNFAVNLSLVLTVSVGFLFVPECVFAQSSSRFGTTPGARGGLYGRGISDGISNGISNGGARRSPLHSAPSFNPAPSLTPHQVFRPAPSLSPGQVFNPSPSLFRPRSAATVARSGSSRILVSGAAVYPSARKLAAMPRSSLSLWLGVGVAELQGDLSRFRNGPAWGKYLRLELLLEVASQESSNADDGLPRQDLAKLLRTFDSIHQDDAYRRVRMLNGFAHVRATLKELIEPARIP